MSAKHSSTHAAASVTATAVCRNRESDNRSPLPDGLGTGRSYERSKYLAVKRRAILTFVRCLRRVIFGATTKKLSRLSLRFDHRRRTGPGDVGRHPGDLDPRPGGPACGCFAELAAQGL